MSTAPTRSASPAMAACCLRSALTGMPAAGPAAAVHPPGERGGHDADGEHGRHGRLLLRVPAQGARGPPICCLASLRSPLAGACCLPPWLHQLHPPRRGLRCMLHVCYQGQKSRTASFTPNVHVAQSSIPRRLTSARPRLVGPGRSQPRPCLGLGCFASKFQGLGLAAHP